MPDTIAYKVLTTTELAALEADATFPGSADDVRDGYIHLSTADQLAVTIDKHYAARTDLALAAVDLEALADIVKWEPSRDAALFPHLYGALPLDAVVAYGPLERGADGAVVPPVAG